MPVVIKVFYIIKILTIKILPCPCISTKPVYWVSIFQWIWISTVIINIYNIMVHNPSMFLLNLWVRDSGPDKGSSSWSVICTFVSKHIVCSQSLDKDNDQFWTNFVNISGIQFFVICLFEFRSENYYKTNEY